MTTDIKPKIKEEAAPEKMEASSPDLCGCIVVDECGRYVDPCGCYVDPCVSHVEPCGCYAEPCSCDCC
ncbi:MAG: hypothetical protein WA081_09390 [Desulfosalsimonadaceae bacterium]